MIAILAAAIADLCGPAPAPAVPADPDDAARYVQVGDQARTGGDERVAAVAYRAALARDPSSAAARSALAEMCRDARAHTDDTAELIAAVALYRAGRLDAAESALSALAAAGGPSQRGAHFFLGVIALAHHEGGDAVRELELARADPTYAAPADQLLPLAHRDGTISVIALVEPELDTNPALLPDTPPAGSMLTPPKVDDDLLLAATVTAHPARWFYVRDAVLFRKQHEQASLDYFGETATVGAELASDANHVDVRYDFDYDLLDGSAYLAAHRGHVQVRHELDGVGLVASYAIRRRDFQDVAQAAFTGWVQTGDAGAIVRISPGFEVDARAAVARELTEDSDFSNLALGATMAARARIATGIRLSAATAGWYAIYDGAEPDGSLRRDTRAEASTDLEIDLGDHVLVTFGGGVIGNASTVDDFRYAKLVVRCGLAFAIGGP